MGRDQPCERSYWGNSSQVVEFLGNRISQKAKHGVAGTTGSSLAYAPSKGFTGSDEFTVAVDYKDATGPGKFFIHFSVTVQ